MPTLTKPTDLIIGRGLIYAETVAQELRAKLVRELAKRRATQSSGELIYIAREILWEFEPLLAHGLRDADLAAWIEGASHVVNRIPDRLFDRNISDPSNDDWWNPHPEQFNWLPRRNMPPLPPKPPGTIGSLFGDDDDEPVISFPRIQQAADSLMRRNIVTREQYDRLTQQARNQAFTVAGESSEDALRTIRDTLAEDLSEGTSLSGFKKRLRESLEGSRIGPAHLENVFRTNIQTAFSDGHEEIADNPIVDAMFPYMEYQPIDDARCRPEHLALGSLGLNGTGLYRRDDPMWNFFLPPWDYNCRCSYTLNTIEAAARKGVKEAQKWLRTGIPPEQPEWRIDFIKFRPKNGFGGRARRLMAA